MGVLEGGEEGEGGGEVVVVGAGAGGEKAGPVVEGGVRVVVAEVSCQDEEGERGDEGNSGEEGEERGLDEGAGAALEYRVSKSSRVEGRRG